MAAELGFEPRHTESESAVLPLHNSAISIVVKRFVSTDNSYYTRFSEKVNTFFKKILNYFLKPFYVLFELR
jgi:hypothetical protein